MNAQLLNDIEQLPPEAQQKIEAFIISMKQLYQPKKQSFQKKNLLACGAIAQKCKTAQNG